MTELGNNNFALIGTGGGTAQLRLQKSDTGTVQIEFYSDGVRRGQIELATTENLGFRTYDSSGTLTSTTSVDNATGEWTFPGEITIGGALDHNGSTVGFFGVTPAARPTTYAASNVVTDRTYDANATSTDELADVLGTLIADLRTMGLVT